MDLRDLWAIFGPAVSGAVFAAGWWFWVDAVVYSPVAVSFLHYLPGIFSCLAVIMFNCVRREDIDYSPYEDNEWRQKWMQYVFITSTKSRKGKEKKTKHARFLLIMKAMLFLQVETLAFPRLRRIICIFGCFCGALDTRCTCDEWPFSLDRNCRCSSVCLRVN